MPSLIDSIAIEVSLTPEELAQCASTRVLKRTVRSTRAGELKLSYESGKTTDNKRIIPSEISSLVPEGKTFGFDTIWDVTRMRFAEFKQRETIQKELPFHISTGSVSNLSREGLCYLACCHVNAAANLGNYFRAQAFILNIDGTNEGGQYTHYRCIDNATGIVVFARKIRSENREDIVAILKEIIRLFGRPHAVVSDMSAAVRKAVVEVFGEHFPHIICQFHFLRDVGKDLLLEKHEKLRSYIASAAMTVKLNRYKPVLASLIENNNGELREDYIKIEQLLNWILDYKNDLSGKGMPFDLSWMRYYERVREAVKTISKIEAGYKPYRGRSRSKAKNARPQKPESLTKLKAVKKSLNSLLKNTNALTVYKQLCTDNALFTELRNVFWLSDENNQRNTACPPLSRNSTGHENDTQVEQIRNDLNTIINRIEGKPDEDQTQGEKIVLTHLKKYLPFLAVELIVDGEKIPLPRTNNMCELYFRETKRGIRMITGQKNLSKAMDQLPAEMAYMRNLENEQYIKIVFGDGEICDSFSRVDQQQFKGELSRMKNEMPEYLIGKPIRKATFIQDFKVHFNAS